MCSLGAWVRITWLHFKHNVKQLLKDHYGGNSAPPNISRDISILLLRHSMPEITFSSIIQHLYTYTLKSTESIPDILQCCSLKCLHSATFKRSVLRHAIMCNKVKVAVILQTHHWVPFVFLLNNLLLLKNLKRGCGCSCHLQVSMSSLWQRIHGVRIYSSTKSHKPQSTFRKR